MAAVIDKRLKEAESEPNITENFNRVLGIADALEKRIADLERKTSVSLLKSVSFTRDGSEALELSPEFSPSVFEYTATADANDWELALQLADDDAQASVKVGDGEAVAYTAPMTIELVPTGTTAIQITVSAPYHTTDAVYTITVTVE